MLKVDYKKAQAAAKGTAGQAATELAVFGAILIFLLGTIVRTAVGNSYTQDQNFKAMRMALLASWNGSKAGNTARNQAAVLIVEDRLSPDFNKYGDLDRNPYIATGSGSFSYEMLYPLSQASDYIAGLPIIDVYVNGQQFPFTQASYVQNRVFTPHACASGGPYLPSSSGSATLTQSQCLQNQCLRDQRSWVGGIVNESSFNVATIGPITLTGTTSTQRATQMQNNACTVFTDLSSAQIFSSGTITPGTYCTGVEQGVIDPNITLPAKEGTQGATYSQWAAFVGLYTNSFPNNSPTQNSQYLQAILNILLADNHKYKLFYEIVPNPGAVSGDGQFSPVPPTCTSSPCVNKALTSGIETLNDQNVLGYWNGVDPNTGVNHTGDMMYDLLRNGDYDQVDASVGSSPIAMGTPVTTCTSPPANNMRCYVGWQWAATAATSAASIGLITSTNNYPTYDVDGRLKEVTVYGPISYNPAGPSVTVSYEDMQGGDIDPAWDSNSCGVKPGLQSNLNMFTFTQNGTYLQINEGKLYNTETGQVVRSVNKRDNIDLIQREIQLSNNTGRFCTIACTDGSTCGAITPGYCANNSICTTTGTSNHVCGSQSGDTECAVPNPVEVCVGESAGSATDNCFTSANIAQTCYDTALNAIFVRSRLEDRRGRFWMTKAAGQLKVQ